MRLPTLIAIAVTMCALPALAGERPTAPAPRAVPARITKVYPVSDLVNADQKQGERLAELVTSYVRPYSWQNAGGYGTAEYFELGCALVVTNTPDVQKEVGDLLEALERLQKGAADRPHAHQLRNAAAADAAGALAKHLEHKRLKGRVTFDVPTNTVYVSGAPEALLFARTTLLALDRPVPQVVLSVLVLKVSDGFVAECGLDVGAAPGATSWTLSPREARMLTAIVRGAKARGECEVLSRPTLQVGDNQTGFVQIGQNPPLVAAGGEKPAHAPFGITLRATPRVTPEGKLRLRTEAQITETAPVALTTTVPGLPFPVTQVVATFNTQSLQAITELKDGETFAARVGETLIIVTPTVARE
ncbi:MAG: hypothetical protein J0I06_26575 [Planctomycetes bacterium]|nr:hypothetical protein [Planctomycetota bacterium]